MTPIEFTLQEFWTAWYEFGQMVLLRTLFDVFFRNVRFHGLYAHVFEHGERPDLNGYLPLRLSEDYAVKGYTVNTRVIIRRGLVNIVELLKD